MAFTQPCVATLLLLLRVVYLAIVVHCQQPFSVGVSSRAGQRNNLVTLQCVQNDGTGVQNAVFYRNGVSQREDVCLSTGMALSGGQYRLMLGPACEGHYMCGIEGNMGRTAQLSGPKKIYG